MKITNIAERITQKITELEHYKNNIKKLGDAKDIESANYEKQLAKTIIKIRNGAEIEIDGQRISNPPVSIIEKIAKGACWSEKLRMDSAETAYKANQSMVSIAESQLNGYQSIFKHMAVA